MSKVLVIYQFNDLPLAFGWRSLNRLDGIYITKLSLAGSKSGINILYGLWGPTL